MRAWTGLFLVLATAVARAQPADPAPPDAVPAATSTFSGVVRDQGDGGPIAGARVEVIGVPAPARTAADGTFRVELEPGTYTVRVTAPGRLGRTIPKLVVTAGKPARVEVRLAAAPEPDPGSLIVNVIARLRRAAESAQLARRKGAATVSETISAETMKKSAGSDASAAVQRATAVTVREGGGTKTVFVRGLGERYTTALLNGSRLPSPDALRRAVPLDLFPADFLEGIDVVKGFTPDLPGDFSGGLIDMRLRDFPDRLTYGFGLSTGGNTSTTGQDFLTYDGGGAGDYFGLGESARNWPAAVPEFNIGELPAARRFALARRFENVWSPETRDAPPDWGATMSVGNTIGPFGFQLGGVYGARWRTITDAIQRQFTNAGTPEDPDIVVSDDFRASRGQFLTRLGGVLTSSYRPSPDHVLNMRAFVNRSSTDETRVDEGTTFQGDVVRQSRLRYVEDELAFGQLAGEHDLHLFRVDWRTVLARTTRDEPDTRHTSYIRPAAEPNAPPRFDNQALGGTRISNETREDLTDSALDFTVPFETGLPGTDVWSGLRGKLKFGPAYSFRDRSFQQRRVEFVPDSGGVDTTLPPEDVLAPDNVGPGGVDVSEATLPTDRFKGTHEIIGGYGMLELPLVRDRLRVIGGARVEYSLIRVSSFVFGSTDQCGSDTICRLSFKRKTFDALPSLNLVYNPVKDMNVRLAWSQSVSRPELRELAPADFPAQRGERSTQGNPDLEAFTITSWDARWEWFFSPLEVVSLGVFYKEMDQPIERFTLIRSSEFIDTFANSGEGTVLGVEFEVRKDFGFVRPTLKKLGATLNFTWLESEVDVGQPTVFGTRSLPTSATRSMIGNAPFQVNAAIEWADPEVLTARLAYSTVDRVIEAAGTQGVPDTYEERRDVLDLVVLVPLQRFLGLPVSAKLSAENLLNDHRLYTVGDQVQRRWIDGVTFGFGLSYAR